MNFCGSYVRNTIVEIDTKIATGNEGKFFMQTILILPLWSARLTRTYTMTEQYNMQTINVWAYNIFVIYSKDRR